MKEVGFSHPLQSRGGGFPVVWGALVEMFRQYKFGACFLPGGGTASGVHLQRDVRVSVSDW